MPNYYCNGIKDWERLPRYLLYQRGARIISHRAVGVELEAEFCRPATPNANKLDFPTAFPDGVGVGGDGSLHNGIEVRLPPAVGAHAEELIKQCCRLTRRKGYRIEGSCGLHIHLSATDYTRKGRDLARLVRFCLLAEPAILLLLPPGRRNRQYTPALRSNQNPRYIPDGNLAYNAIMHILHRLGLVSRYGLNLSCLQDSTGANIEIRYHHGSLNPTRIIEWVILWQAILDEAKHIKDRDFRKLARLPFKQRLGLIMKLIKLDPVSIEYFRERHRAFSRSALPGILLGHKKAVKPLLMSIPACRGLSLQKRLDAVFSKSDKYY